MHNVPTTSSGVKYNDVVKLQIWQEVDMTKDGYLHWNPRLRPFVAKRTFKPVLRIDVSVWDIDTLDKLARSIYESCGASPENGFWIVMRLSKGKTKTHWKWVRIAKLKIRSTGDSWTYTATSTARLKRSWYYKLANSQIHAENNEEGDEENE
jgi:hypothetical protein